MNEQDSRGMLVLLNDLGYQKTDDLRKADLILINTCSIRANVENKVYSELGRLRNLKENRLDLIVVVAGCVAQQEADAIATRFPFVDIVLGPDGIVDLPELVKMAETKVKKDHPVTFKCTVFKSPEDYRFLDVGPVGGETLVKAFVNIQKGCDNICAYCIVPHVRGREVSRPHAQIISEIRQLVALGVKEVTLLGQNVNSYGQKEKDGVSFADLLALIAKETDLKRLRFTTSHPRDVGDDLIEQFAVNPILLPHMHLPVQSGSNRILKLMNRQYTREHFLTVIEAFLKKVPAMRFATDMIVGFPTETEEDFLQTLDLMRQVRFVQIFSFVYSPRPHTRAARLVDDVPLGVKEDRLQVLQRLDREIVMDRNESDVGTEQLVLVEDHDETAERPFKGRTEANQIVHFRQDGLLKPGDFAKVKITQANPHSLFGG